MTATEPLEIVNSTDPHGKQLFQPTPDRFDGRRIKKTLFTLNVNNYEPRVTELTYPLLRNYASKIGADFQVITERRFPEWPVVYEKLQIHELGRVNDWNIYIDSDALVSPEFFDITEHLRKDTVCQNGKDMAGIRWRYDQYFRRDGRNIGCCNWFTVGSDWCLDLWRPLDDLTFEEAVKNINITIGEHNSGQCKHDHLIDDYTLSRNVARFGLKYTTVTEICAGLGWKGPDGRGFSPFLHHLYTLSTEEKLKRMLAVLSTPNGMLILDPRDVNTGQPQRFPPWGIGWGLMDPMQATALVKEWGLK